MTAVARKTHPYTYKLNTTSIVALFSYMCQKSQIINLVDSFIC